MYKITENKSASVVSYWQNWHNWPRFWFLKQCADRYRASISMAIDRVSILYYMYRMSFSNLRRRGLSGT